MAIEMHRSRYKDVVIGNDMTLMNTSMDLLY